MTGLLDPLTLHMAIPPYSLHTVTHGKDMANPLYIKQNLKYHFSTTHCVQDPSCMAAIIQSNPSLFSYHICRVKTLNVHFSPLYFNRVHKVDG